MSSRPSASGGGRSVRGSVGAARAEPAAGPAPRSSAAAGAAGRSSRGSVGEPGSGAAPVGGRSVRGSVGGQPDGGGSVDAGARGSRSVRGSMGEPRAPGVPVVGGRLSRVSEGGERPPSPDPSGAAGSKAPIAEVDEKQAAQIRESIRSMRASQGQNNNAVPRVQGIQLCFLLDITGSMQRYMNAVKDKIRSLVADVGKLWPGTPFEQCFIGYRDVKDAEPFVKLPFMPAEQLEAHLAALVGSGGGDLPEDVLGGIFEATWSLEWTAHVRILIHIGDAPPHGDRFRPEGARYEDDYPKGTMELSCPGVPNLTALMEDLTVRKINYFFLRVHAVTSKMEEELRDAYNKQPTAPGPFQVHDMSGATAESLARDFSALLMASIRESCRRSTAYGVPRPSRPLAALGSRSVRDRDSIPVHRERLTRGGARSTGATARPTGAVVELDGFPPPA